MKKFMITPKAALIYAILIVAASTTILPSITGYGTILSQVVVLGAWGLVAAFTSGAFADQSHVYIWLVAGFLNVVLFAIPGFLMFWILRNRAPKIYFWFLSIWLVFYLASLFLLFPAKDGP